MEHIELPEATADELELARLRESIMRGEIAQPERPDTEPLPANFHDIEMELIEGLTFADELNARIEALKAKLLAAMEVGIVKKWESDRLIITRTEPSIRYSVDTKKFKAEYEDIYNKCLRGSETKSSIRITIKKQKTS